MPTSSSKAAKPIRPPVLPDDLAVREISARDLVETVEGCRVDKCTLARIEASALRFDGVHLQGAAFEESRIVNLSWLDVLCERSNLSMLEWRGAKLTRVVLRGCRVTGAKLREGEFDSVRFVDCHVDYASFAATRFRQVAFESCQLREVDFHGADLTGTSFTGCELDGADFSGAKLQGVDISASNTHGISVGPSDVRGLVVNRQQAAELAKLFGLVVKD